MSVLFDGTNDTLTGTFSTTFNAYPFSIACFVKFTDHPVAVDNFLAIGSQSASVDGSHALRTSSTDNSYQGATQDDSSALSAISVGPLTFDATWFGCVYVCTSTTLRDLYVNAIGNTVQSTTSRTVSAVQFIRFGETFAAGADYTGRLAEGAMWNVALTTQEITDYLGGIRASTIRSSSLKGYWPLKDDLLNAGTDSGGGLTAGGNAALDPDHPTILGGVTGHKRRLLMGVG